MDDAQVNVLRRTDLNRETPSSRPAVKPRVVSATESRVGCVLTQRNDPPLEGCVTEQRLQQDGWAATQRQSSSHRWETNQLRSSGNITSGSAPRQASSWP